MLKIGSNSGNFTVLLSVMGVAGFSLFVLSSNIAKTNQKAKSIASEKAVIDAEQINRSAISYLNTSLEQDEVSGLSPLTVVNNKITGASVGLIEIANSKASFYSINPSNLAATTLKLAMEGSEPQPNMNNHIKTQLEILDTIPQPGYDVAYDVKATTTIQENAAGANARPVSTVARIKIHSYLAELMACTSKGGTNKNKFCFFYGKSGANCASTCGAQSLGFDQVGANYTISSDQVCSELLDSFSAPASRMKQAAEHPAIAPSTMGCKYYPGFLGLYKGRWRLAKSDQNSKYPGVRRVCACK